jgi:cell division protein FtsB
MHPQNKKGKFFTSLFLTPYFFTLGCLVILAAITLPVYKNISQRYEVDKEISDLQKQIIDLQTSNEDLTKLKTYLQSDQFAEKEARLNLGLKKPGEQVAVVEDAVSANGISAEDNLAAAAIKENKNSNPVRWWNYFFGR